MTMKNNNRRRKYPDSSEKDVEDAVTDRLSCLPDCIIYHILSFMSTKCAVQTSVLSKRWRCAWKHVPVLILDSVSFPVHDDSFSMFVDKVLSLHRRTTVSKIIYADSLYDTEYPVDDSLVTKVVEYAVSHETRHLVLHLSHLYDDSLIKFPEAYGTDINFSLETLYLDGFYIDNRLVSCRFPMLTSLELVACMFMSDEYLFQPVCNFPSLKSLIIDTSSWNIGVHDENKRFRIAGPKLQNLELLYVSLGNMEISAPKLKSFKLLDGGRCLKLSELDVPSLDYACLDIEGNILHDGAEFASLDTDWYVHRDTEFTIEGLVTMLEGCHNVKSLTLGRTIIKVLTENAELLDEEPPFPFKRLEELKLQWNPSNIPYKVVSYFLGGSCITAPSIQILPYQ